MGKLICLGIIFFLTPILSFATNQATITAIRIFPTDYSTRIIFNLSKTTSVHTFSLDNPNRLVFDFDHTVINFHLNRLRFVPSPLKNIRSGHPEPETLRIVMDVKSPFTFKKLVQLDPSQIVFDVYIKKGASFSKGVSEKVKSISSFTSIHKHGSVSHDSVAGAKDRSIQNELKSPSLQSVVKTKPFIVVIDPGHGGKDTGAIGVYKTREKDIVLSIATQLADLINQQPNMRAVMTRRGDYFVTLANRLVLARKGEADLFVAIHADSYFNNRANGASVFALSSHGATTVAARWLSDSDNHSELGGVELNNLSDQSYLLRSVLIDLAQTATIQDSLRLGNSILDMLEDMTKLHASRVEQAPFMVLKSPDIPSVLVETGFVSNGPEELRLRDPSYQHKIALALFNGIRLYQKKYAPEGI